MPTTSTTLTEAKVLRVIDGDTIEVILNGTVHRIRYVGIDAPELDDERAEIRALAQQATEYNRKLIGDKILQLEKDVSENDIFGRLLRHVYVGSIFVSAELVRLGYAQAKTYPPDVKYQDRFVQLEKEAKEAGRGLWATSRVQITYIFYDGLVPRVESDEYVEVGNLGNQPQNLAGWVLKHMPDGPSFVFPSYILAPQKKIRVYTNENHSEWGGFSFKYSRAVWNNSELDVAVLYNNQGKEVSRKSY